MKYKKSGAPKKIAHWFNVYRLLSELEADRYAYLACGDLDTCISYEYKRIGGIDIKKFGVPANQFIEGNHKRVQMFFDGGQIGSNTHPYDAILTSDMHAEFTIDTETELKHKAGCVWKLLSSHYTQAQLARYCALYGITIEQALQLKKYWI